MLHQIKFIFDKVAVFLEDNLFHKKRLDILKDFKVDILFLKQSLDFDNPFINIFLKPSGQATATCKSKQIIENLLLGMIILVRLNISSNINQLSNQSYETYLYIWL